MVRQLKDKSSQKLTLTLARTWQLEEEKREKEEKGKPDGDGAPLIVWCRWRAGKPDQETTSGEGAAKKLGGSD